MGLREGAGLRSKQGALSPCCCRSRGCHAAAGAGAGVSLSSTSKTICCCYQPAPAEHNKDHHLPQFVFLQAEWCIGTLLLCFSRRGANHSQSILLLPPFPGRAPFIHLLQAAAQSTATPLRPVPLPRALFPASSLLPHLAGLRWAALTAVALHALPLLCR